MYKFVHYYQFVVFGEDVQCNNHWSLNNNLVSVICWVLLNKA